MTEKEIGELRRRFRPEKSNITRVRGCYVNEKGEILSEFQEAFGLIPENESEEMLALLRKTLSGTTGKNLFDIAFSNQQVLEGEEHLLLMDLRQSALQDDEAVHRLYGRIVSSLRLEGNYLILLACENYDVPYYQKDGEKSDSSADVFSYILCSICPVRLTKPALGYHSNESCFCTIRPDWAVMPPELGFLFPAFDDRTANIYNALYYCKDTANSHAPFVDAIFQSEVPMPAAVQKETFDSILGDTLEGNCDLNLVQTVHEQFREMIAEHKASKVEEPLVVSRLEVQNVLTECGVPKERVTAFAEQYDREFGVQTELSPKNIVDVKQFALKTPDVTIHVNPERSDLVQTKVLDGVKYILIRANEGVTVNGVSIHIS